MSMVNYFTDFIQKLNEKDLRIEVKTYDCRPMGANEFNSFNIVNKDSTKKWMRGYVYIKFKALRTSQQTPIQFELIVDYPKIAEYCVPAKDLGSLYEYRDKLLYFVTLLNEAKLPSSCMFDLSLINALLKAHKNNNMRLSRKAVEYKRGC